MSHSLFHRISKQPIDIERYRDWALGEIDDAHTTARHTLESTGTSQRCSSIRRRLTMFLFSALCALLITMGVYRSEHNMTLFKGTPDHMVWLIDDQQQAHWTVTAYDNGQHLEVDTFKAPPIQSNHTSTLIVSLEPADRALGRPPTGARLYSGTIKEPAPR